MIFLGMICMFFFLAELLSLGADNVWLYWMLMLSLGYFCLKIVHEWIHYLFITVPQKPKADRQFSVDILTTFCKGEPYEMITETLEAILKITYPHETYLCDEANDPYLRDFCKQRGIHHVTRLQKINAKAGNINNALQQAKGELCLILDPDHVPFPDFLDPIVSHFNDPQIGYVQVVQSYKNQGESLIAKGAAQQTYQFYGPMMMTMNHYGTVLAIGANCTFRRAALDSIGGHAAGLAEDMHTAMQLHAKGWKSKYVPAVVARGLVPSSLSAYYGQQLKWSRGVFELLVTSYPRLFRQFSWQQKLHYGTIPLFYLSGVFFLINFLIPIFSLLLNTSPAQIDFDSFLTLGLPLLTAIMLIRHYVQTWVMEEEERGFHVAGGLLMIGTWWIYLLGFYYTLLRKVVPYNPTPKDGNESNNWPLNYPNLLIIIASVFAVGYGLSHDFNPYNLFMAGFALLNCLILSFTIAASRQSHFRQYKADKPGLIGFMAKLAEFKSSFWKFRRKVYGFVRETTFMLAVMLICFSVYIIRSQKLDLPFLKEVPARKDLMVTGISLPAANKLQSVGSMSAAHAAMKPGIFALQMAWGKLENEAFPAALLDSIYQYKAIPLISWGPDTGDAASMVYRELLNGKYDGYLDKFSDRIAEIGRPVFIRFTSAKAEPQPYPNEAPLVRAERYKAVYKYVHQYFERKLIRNVIWVWNAGAPETVSAYFPGKDYVDWIGLAEQHITPKKADEQRQRLGSIYESYRKLPAFNLGLPVMLLDLEAQENLIPLLKRHNEIKTVVFAPSVLERKNAPLKALETALENGWTNTSWFSRDKLDLDTIPSVNIGARHLKQMEINGLRAVLYDKSQNWRTSYQNLKIAEIEDDFSAMKKIGINTIKHYGPNIYDYNILQVAAKSGLKVIYSFWLPADIDYLAGDAQLRHLKAQILKTVKSLKNHQEIRMWNIGPSPLPQLRRRYTKPDLLYADQRYFHWLAELSRAIKAIDPLRPLSADLTLNSRTAAHARLLVKYAPDLDYLGLTVPAQAQTKPNLALSLHELPKPFFFSSIATADYLRLSAASPAAVIENWQDQDTRHFVTFNGLQDLDGNHKAAFYQLQQKWTGKSALFSIPEIQILKPAVTLFGGMQVTYHILDRQAAEWRLRPEEDGLEFSWQLVNKNRENQEIERKQLGKGLYVHFEVPENPQNYDLYVHVIRDNQVRIIKTSLNTPLY